VGRNSRSLSRQARDRGDTDGLVELAHVSVA